MAKFDNDGFPLHYDYEDLPLCDSCNSAMLPNLSTWDSAPVDDDGTVEGCGWNCVNPSCSEFSAGEVEVEDILVLGVPPWLADIVAGLCDTVSECCECN